MVGRRLPFLLERSLFRGKLLNFSSLLIFSGERAKSYRPSLMEWLQQKENHPKVMIPAKSNAAHLNFVSGEFHGDAEFPPPPPPKKKKKWAPRESCPTKKNAVEPPVWPPHTKERPNLHLGKDRCHEVEIFIAPIVCDHHIGRTITTSRQHGRIGRGVFWNAGFPESCGWLIGSSTQKTHKFTKIHLQEIQLMEEIQLTSY